MLIATHKSGAAGISYTQFALKAIVHRDLFEYLSLDPTQVWAAMLFMDPENWSGIEFYGFHELMRQYGIKWGIGNWEWGGLGDL